MKENIFDRILKTKSKDTIDYVYSVEDAKLSPVDTFIAHTLIALKIYKKETGEDLTLEKWLEVCSNE